MYTWRHEAWPVDGHLTKSTKHKAKIADLHVVDRRIPYFPFANSPFRNGQKHRTTIMLHMQYPSQPWAIVTDSCFPRKPMINAVSCSSRTAVPAGTKISEASKVNLPSSPSLFEDWSFSTVTSKTVSDILKTFKITLKTPNNHAFIVFILAILRLFHHARIDNPVSRYSMHGLTIQFRGTLLECRWHNTGKGPHKYIWLAHGPAFIHFVWEFGRI